MIRRLLELWDARNRRFDLKVLWPICKKEAPDLDHAKAAFACHVAIDPAWQKLDRAVVMATIDGLE